VGDAASQLTDGLHFLRLRELQFQRFLIGGIDQIEGNGRLVIILMGQACDIELSTFLSRTNKINIINQVRRTSFNGLLDFANHIRQKILIQQMFEPICLFNTHIIYEITKDIVLFQYLALGRYHGNPDGRIHKKAFNTHLL